MGSKLWIHNGNEHLDQISGIKRLLGVCIGLPLLMMIVVGMRLYIRIFILKSLGSDDWATVVSLVCGFIYAGLCIGQMRWGLGLPVNLRPPENLKQYAAINFAGRPFYMVGILAFKVALCLGCLRILHGSRHRRYISVIKVVMAMAVLSHSIGILILLLQCRPVHKSWNPDVEGTCFPDGPTFYGLAAVTIVFDVVIIPLPIPALLKLQISKAKKWVLFFVIALGGFTTACSALRVWQISIMTKTQDSTLLVLWGVIELNVGIIMTCIPTLGPLFRGFVRRSSNPYLPNRAVRLQALNPRAREPATPRPLSFSPDSSFNPPAPTHGNYASSEEETVGLRNAGAATTPHDDGEILMTSEIHATVDHIDCGTSSRRTSAPW